MLCRCMIHISPEMDDGVSLVCIVCYCARWQPEGIENTACAFSRQWQLGTTAYVPVKWQEKRPPPALWDAQLSPHEKKKKQKEQTETQI